MTRLAEMSVSPTEPLGDAAAELALKFDEVSTMSLTILLPTTNTNCCTLPTN